MTEPRNNSNQNIKPATAERYEKILKNFSRKSVLVIGDLMWDEYIRGSVSRISPEAPVPVVRSEHETRVPGGATNVLKNLVDLKVKTGIIGMVGADRAGDELIEDLQNSKLNTVEIYRADDRPTIMKTRIMARHQQLLRLDREVVKPVPDAIAERLLKNLSEIISDYNAVILSDYDKGIFTPKVISGIIELAHQHNVYVAVDPQVRHFRLYKGADVMTPNEKEASEGIGLPLPETDAEAREIALKIKNEVQLKHVLLTRSEKGMAVLEDEKITYVPTVAREVFDVTGAGDTVIAVYTSAIAAGASPVEAALLSNIAGGIVVGRLGTATVKRRELNAELSPGYFEYREKKL